MNNNRTKNAVWNILFSLILQMVIFVRGLILPRLIIPAYGSDVNGLISSITQFLSYIALLEAGVGSIFRVSLYKPLAAGDMPGVSGIINEQKRFYRRIALIFIGYVAVLCAVYPLIAKTNVNAPYVISCILILSVSTFAEYFVSLPYASLLSADQKVRISYLVSIVYTVVNILVAVFFVWLKADIRWIYLSMSVLGLLRPLFYTLYVKKHYALDSKARADRAVLGQRWNGIVHHFAFYIHTNTDASILTIFISTAAVSVYNVYGAIVFGMEKIISSVSSGVAAGLGNMLVTGSREETDRTVDAFELVQGGLATVVYTVTAIMLMPFVRLYTAQMTDENYIQPVFGFVLILAEWIYCFRCIYSSVSQNANKFKETQFGAILECAVNLAVSILLVTAFKLGLLGVAIGTAVAMLSRYIFEVVFLSKNVLYRPVKRAVGMLAVSLIVAAVSILLCRWLIVPDAVTTAIQWIIKAVPVSAVTAVVAVGIYSLAYFGRVKGLWQRYISKR